MLIQGVGTRWQDDQDTTWQTRIPRSSSEVTYDQKMARVYSYNYILQVIDLTKSSTIKRDLVRPIVCNC